MRFRHCTLVGFIVFSIFSTSDADAATFVVDRLDDAVDAPARVCSAAPADCSLRGAVLEANALPGWDTIQLEAGATYVLSLGDNDEDLGAEGDLDVIDSLVVDGAGATIDAGGIDRIFDALGASLEIEDLTLRGGANSGYGIHADGGAIRSAGGNLELTEVRLEGNEAYEGGAVYLVDGSLILDLSTVVSNHSETSGGAVYVESGTARISDTTFDGNVAGEWGGAIRFDGTELTVGGSMFFDNRRSGPESQGDGGAIFIDDGAAVIERSEFRNNVAEYPGMGLCARGGAIAADWFTSLTVTDSEFESNVSGYHGGAIYAEGTLDLVDVTVTANSSTFDGGGVALRGGVGFFERVDLVANEGRFGGAVYANSDENSAVVLDMVEVTATDNVATGGGGMWLEGDRDDFPATYSIVDGSFARNETTSDDGGGVYHKGHNSTLTILRGWFSHNVAAEDGGAIANAATGYGEPVLEIRRSTLFANAANRGGGMHNTGFLFVHTTEITDNVAAAGGGISSTRAPVGWGDNLLVLNRSLVAHNEATNDGGGLFVLGLGSALAPRADAVIINSTVSGNQAEGHGGGLAVGEESARVAVQSSTFFQNVSLQQPGDAVAVSEGTIDLRNSIVATASEPDCWRMFGGTITSAGHNLESGTTCGFLSAGDQQNATPQLGWLEDNGGPTRTHALASGSPAIDAGDPAGCLADRDGDFVLDTNPLQGDQRFVPRQGVCDIGAYEFEPVF